MNQQPIVTQLNNGIIVANSAMPMKDLTSNNEAEFSMSRKLFNKSYFLKPSLSLSGTSIIQRESLGLSTKVVIDGDKSVNQKKWIGGNRDASSMISRRKINNTGSILSASNSEGSSSFKNVADNNTQRNALIRCRAGGYRVPPSVTQKHVMPIAYGLPPNIPFINQIAYLQIISNGLRYSSINNIYSYGVYNYDPITSMTTPIMSASLGNAGRSYNLLTISRTTGAITKYPPYDVFGNSARATALSNLLNSLTDNVIVIIFTFDEPKTNSGLLQAAFQRCGASESFNSMIEFRGAYSLVGIPGIGLDGGLEQYTGIASQDGDPNASTNIYISILNGMYTDITG